MCRKGGFMRIFIMVSLIVFCFRPVFASSDLKSGYIKSCENHFRKSPAFCQCSYNEFTASALNDNEKTTPINFEQQRQYLENEIKENEEILSLDKALYPARISKVCHIHDDIDEANALLNKNDAKPKITEDQRRVNTLRVVNLKKQLHDILKRYSANSKSYEILGSGDVCHAKRMLKKLKKDQRNIPVEKHPSGLTNHMITKLSGGTYGHIDLIVVGEKAKCPK